MLTRFLLIWLISFVKDIIADTNLVCSPFCSECKPEGECLKCNTDFEISPNNQTDCISSQCGLGEYYDKNSCVIEDSYRHACRNVFPCPLLYSKGQEFPSNKIKKVILDTYQKQLLSWAENQNVMNLWDYQTGAITATLRGHQDVIVGAYIDSKVSDTLVSFTERGEIFFWNYTEGVIINKTNRNRGYFNAKSYFNPTLHEIVSYGYDGDFYYFDYTNDQIEVAFKLSNGLPVHTQTVKGVVKNGNFLYSYSNDQLVVQWQLIASGVNQYTYTSQVVRTSDGPIEGIKVFDYENMTAIIIWGGVYNPLIIGTNADQGDGSAISVYLFNHTIKYITRTLEARTQISLVQVDVKNKRFISISQNDKELIVYSYQNGLNALKVLTKMNSIRSTILQVYEKFIITLDGRFTSIWKYNRQTDDEPILELDDQFMVQSDAIEGVVFDDSQGRGLICYGDDLTVFDSVLKITKYQINNIDLDTKKHWKGVNGVIFLDADLEVITYSKDGSILVWKDFPTKLLHNFTHPSYTNSFPEVLNAFVYVMNSERFIMASYMDKSLVSFSLDIAGNVQWTVIGLQFIPSNLIYVPNTEVIVYGLIGGINAVCEIYNLVGGVFVASKQGAFFNVTYTPDPFIYSYDSDGDFYMWSYPGLNSIGSPAIYDYPNKLKGSQLDTVSGFYFEYYVKSESDSDLKVFYLSTFDQYEMFIMNSQVVGVATEFIPITLDPATSNKMITFHLSGEVNIYNLIGSTPKIVVQSLRASDYPIESFQVVQSQNRIFYYSNLGSQGARVSILNVAEMVIETSFDISSSLSQLAVDPINQRIALCFTNGTTGFQKYMTEERIRNIPILTTVGDVVRVQFSPKNDRIVILYSQAIQVLEQFPQGTDPNQDLTVLAGDGKILKNLQDFIIDQENQHIIVFSDDVEQNLFVWRFNQMAPNDLQQLIFHTDSVKGVLLIVGENKLISWGKDARIVVWGYPDLKSAVELKKHQAMVVKVLYDARLRLFTSYSSIGEVIIWNVVNLSQKSNFQVENMNTLLINPDCFDFIAIVQNKLKIFSADNGYYKTTYSDMHELDISGLQFYNGLIYTYDTKQVVSRNSTTYGFFQQFTDLKDDIMSIYLQDIYLIVLCKNSKDMIVFQNLLGFQLAQISSSYSVNLPLLNMFPDQDSNILFTINTLQQAIPWDIVNNNLYTVLYSDQMTDESVTAQFTLDKETNQVILYDKNSVQSIDYFNTLNLISQIMMVPQFGVQSLYFYQPDLDYIMVIDSDLSIWKMIKNVVVFIDNLLFIPRSWQALTNHFIMHDENTIYYLNRESLKTVFYLKIYPDEVYIFESKGIIVVPTWKKSGTYFNINIIKINYSSSLEIIKILSKHTGQIRGVSYADDLNQIITHDANGLICFWSASPPYNFLFDAYQQSKAINQIIFNYQVNQKLVLVTFEGTLIQYRYQATGVSTPRQIFEDPNKNLYSTPATKLTQIHLAVLDYTWNYLFVASYDGNMVVVYNYQFMQPLTTLVPGSNKILKLRVSEIFNVFLVICPFQVTIYNTMKEIYLINYIRIPKSFLDIEDATVISNEFIVISSRSTLSVFYYSVQEVRQERIFYLSSPVIVSFKSVPIPEFSDSYNVNLKGVSKNGFFNFTFTSSNMQVQECWFNFQNTQTFYSIRNDLNLLKESFAQLQINMTLTSLNMALDSAGGLKFVSELSQISDQVNLIYTPLDGGQNLQALQNFVIDENTFLQHQLQNFDMRNFIFNFSKVSNTRLKFNPQINNVRFSNILVKEKIKNVTFEIYNLRAFIVDGITLNQISIENSILFEIKNTKEVKFNSVSCDSTNFNSSIFSDAYNVTDFSINNVNISNSNFTENFQYLIGVQSGQNVVIQKFNIIQNAKIGNNTQRCEIAQLVGNSNSYLSNITYQLNNDCIMLHSTNNLLRGNDQIILLKDKLKVEYSSFKNNFQNGSKTLNNSILDIQSSQALVQFSNFERNMCEYCTGSAIQSVKSLITIFQNTLQTNMVRTKSIKLIKNFFFLSFKGDNGGAIAMIESQERSVIDLCNITDNIAQSSGGGIFFNNSKSEMRNCLLRFNKANIGGGLRYVERIPDFIYGEKQLQTNNLRQLSNATSTKINNNNIIDNTANIFGSNIASYPTIIQITNSKNISLLEQGLYEIKDFRSGGEISLMIQLLDEENNEVFFDPTDQSKYSFQILEELKFFDVRIFSLNTEIQVEGDNYKGSDEFYAPEKAFRMNQISIIGKPLLQGDIWIKSSSIRELSTDQMLTVSQKVTQIHIFFRQCIKGEILVKAVNGNIFCLPCPDSKYSLIEPDNNNFEMTCLPCPASSAIQCEKNQIDLKNEYWRISQDSDVIVYCQNAPENCMAEQNPYLHYCKEGNIGPLCQECDIFAEVSQERYASQGDFNCFKCQDQASQLGQEFAVFILISIVLLISFKQIANLICQQVQAYYLRMIGFCGLGTSQTVDTTGRYIRHLINYWQITFAVSLNLKVPGFIQTIYSLSRSFANPISLMKNMLDCTITQGSMPPLFFRTLFSLAIPFFFLIIGGLLYIFCNLVQIFQIQIHKPYIYTGLLFLFFALQPDFISILFSTLTCREIGGKNYAVGDLTYECWDNKHLLYGFLYSIPMIIIIGFLVPLRWLWRIWKTQNIHQFLRIRSIYGFLYTQYKPQFFYWEFTRSFMKIFMAFINNYLGQYYFLRGLMLLCVIMIYMSETLRRLPFQNATMNQFDLSISIVTVVVTVCNLLWTANEFPSWSQILLVVSITTKLGYECYLIYAIIREKLIGLYTEKIYGSIKRIITKHPILGKCLAYRNTNRGLAYSSWRKLRQVIMQHIQARHKMIPQLWKQIGKDQFARRSTEYSFVDELVKFGHKGKQSDMRLVSQESVGTVIGGDGFDKRFQFNHAKRLSTMESQPKVKQNDFLNVLLQNSNDEKFQQQVDQTTQRLRTQEESVLIAPLTRIKTQNEFSQSRLGFNRSLVTQQNENTFKPVIPTQNMSSSMRIRTTGGVMNDQEPHLVFGSSNTTSDTILNRPLKPLFQPQ